MAQNMNSKDEELKHSVRQFEEKLTELNEMEAIKRAKEALSKAKEDVMKQNEALLKEVKEKGRLVKDASSKV